MLFQNVRLILPDRVTARGSLRCAAGRITEITPGPLEAMEGEETVDLGGAFLAPGFIDLHIHGALHRDSMEASPEAFRTICEYHARGGTTSLALTTVTATHEEILSTLRAVRAYRQAPPTGAQVLGVHIEGPYFSPAKPGAHPLALIRPPDPVEYGAWLEYADEMTQMTLAPELPGALRLIDDLLAHGVRPSAGHSDAWDDEAAEAYAHGLRQVTHTYNCMSTTRRRGPYRAGGLLEFALSEPEVLCEVIADGRHVSPTLLRMLYQAKGPEGIALVTDAAAGAGLADGETFRLGAVDGVVCDEVALTADRQALCSSTATMNRLVRNMTKLVGIPLYEAVRMATLNPARALGREQEIGTLQPGARADLVALDDQLDVVGCFVAGRQVAPSAA